MNLSHAWLQALLRIEMPVDEIAERLAMLGAPVESVAPVHGDLTDVMIASVEHVERHPNADRLSLCRVNTGTEVLEVVCGAPNVAAGHKYPYAPVGGTLPGGLTLTKRKIRGVVSNGMLCSPRELGLGDDHDGILELDTEAAPGTPFVEALGLADACLEIEVTPNRPDLLGHRGVARDLGAALGVPVKLEPIPGAPAETRAPVRTEGVGTVAGVDVSIEDVEGCPRYLAAVVRGVAVGPSPEWLQRRLRAIGQRPINNVVDATNYALNELNQPMHAFDLDKLRGGKVIVRRAREGERLTTLDGEDRVLTPEMTAICDAEGPAAVGGVMGGADSEVTDATTNLLLECAYFDPKRIRATRTALKMNTDASYRYERGTDPLSMPDALRRIVSLIIAVAGGEEPDAPVDVYPTTINMPTVFLRPARVTHLLGVEIPRDQIESYLTRLGFQVAPKDDRLAVQVPGWRPDVTREVDLIEEIARLHGYDEFETQLLPFRPSAVPDDPGEEAKARCRTMLTGFGLHEARGSGLGPRADPMTAEHIADELAQRGQVEVLNPLSVEDGYLRRDLITGLRRSAERNWSVRERNVRLFEIGAVFHSRGPDALPDETLRVAAIITGARSPDHWTTGKSIDFDRWDAKDLFERICRAFGPPGELVAAGDRLEWHDEHGAVRGWAGSVSADAPAWAAPLFAFEADFVVRERGPFVYQALPDTPPAERDLALVIPGGVTAGQVEDTIRSVGGPLLESLTVFDEYRGKEVGGRSVAWRLVFRSRERTLRDKEVDKVVSRILKVLKEQLGVERRAA